MAPQFYYFFSSLPMLSFGDTPPFSSEAFLALASQHLDSQSLNELASVSLLPRQVSPFELERRWAALETYIRNYLASSRGIRLGRDSSRWLQPEPDVFPGLQPQLDEALAAPTPLQREKQLDALRWHGIEDATVGRDFTLDVLVAYRLHLLILEKWRRVSERTASSILLSIVGSSVEEAWDKRSMIG